VPKKKEARYEIAGRRLAIARKVIGKTQRSIVAGDRWAKTVAIYDVKTIGLWENKGVPEDKLKKLSDFLNVPQYLLMDTEIEDEAFRKIIELKNGDPDANIDHLLPSKFRKDGLEGLVDEIEAPNLPLPYENLEVPWDWDEYISNAHDDGDYHFRVGSRCNAEDKYDQAILNLDKAIWADTLNSDLICRAYYERGYSRYKKGALKDAFEDYLKSLHADLDGPFQILKFPWYNRNESSERIKDFDVLVKDFPERAVIYCLRGIEALTLEDYDSAVADFTEAIELEPESGNIADFHCIRGYAFYQKELYSNAIDEFTYFIKKGIILRPQVLYFRALALEKEDRIADAIEDIKKCLHADPNREVFLEKFSALKGLRQR
jgi:tetratricopeptide (TPR) repeat protein